MKRLAVLISGRGSNLEALLGAIQRYGWPIEVACVISNRPNAGGLDIARSKGIPTEVIDHTQFSDRSAFDNALIHRLEAQQPDLVVLAGFMRLLTAEFCARFRHRLVNIHPSLLPAFKGLQTHQQAIDAGVRIHGCTVHLVTAELDHGPILAQAAVSVRHDDTAEALAARVLKMEHEIYPKAIAAWLSGQLTVEDDRIIDRGEGAFPTGFMSCQLHPDLA
ncbi:MAG: phosphoribosylglycinamide formyltransferase [Betaproteobacteria bacterium]|nr:phosphoribosylglycinamide formyltransferase [Betaproteobacteria bacterium]